MPNDRSNRAATSIDYHVGEKLREFRRAQQLSLTELASQLGLSHQQLQKYETARNRISAGMLYSLSKALAVPMEEFFSGLGADGSERSDPLGMARSRCVHVINNTTSLGHLAIMSKILRVVASEGSMTAQAAPD